MAILSTLVSRLPIELRAHYDFTDFWVPQCNILLDEISQVVDMPDNQKEAGVEVSNNFVITPPPDYRRALDVYAYGNQDRRYPFSERDGKIVLRDSYSKDSAQTSKTLHTWTTEKVLVNDGAAALNAYAGKLLVLTNGDGLSGGVGYTHVVSRSTLPGSGVLEAFFEYPLASAYATCTAGYFATLFLMLSYVRKYTALTLSGSEVNLADRFEKALVAGLRWKAMEDIDEGSVGEVTYWGDQWQKELAMLAGKDTDNSTDPTPRESELNELRKNVVRK